MKKIINILLMLLLFSGVYSCYKPVTTVSSEDMTDMHKRVKQAGFAPVNFTYVKNFSDEIIRSGSKNLIVDVRSPSAYSESHIPGSVLVQDGQVDSWLDKQKELFSDKSIEIITSCQSATAIGPLSVANQLRDRGYKNIRVYVEGMSQWQKLQPSEIDKFGAKNYLYEGSAFFIDIRDEKSYEDERIPGAVNIPYDEFEKYRLRLPEDLRADIIIYAGDISYEPYEIAERLINSGYTAYGIMIYRGGFSDWKKSGYRVTSSNPTNGYYRKVENKGLVEGAVNKEFMSEILNSGKKGFLPIYVGRKGDLKNVRSDLFLNISIDMIHKLGCDSVTDVFSADLNSVLFSENKAKTKEMYEALRDDCGFDGISKVLYLDGTVEFSGKKFKVR